LVAHKQIAVAGLNERQLFGQGRFLLEPEGVVTAGCKGGLGLMVGQEGDFAFLRDKTVEALERVVAFEQLGQQLRSPLVLIADVNTELRRAYFVSIPAEVIDRLVTAFHYI
jgi:hypothetical protein